jgi:NAD-dependent dihydropyrimidine dehydrogenase PreA subunit
MNWERVGFLAAHGFSAPRYDLPPMMTTLDQNWGLPRNLIPWGPTIEPARCCGSGGCVRFCPNHVFESDAATGQARVARFHQCTVLCSKCVAICPNGAISFPDQDTFLDAVSELRKQAQSALRPAATGAGSAAR